MTDDMGTPDSNSLDRHVYIQHRVPHFPTMIEIVWSFLH